MGKRCFISWALLALFAAAVADAAAQTSTKTSVMGGYSGSHRPDGSATTPQRQQEGATTSCPPPKSCSIDGNSCSMHTLRGLAATRRQMEAAAERNGADEDATMALTMHMALVRLEEASVGYALLLRRDGAQTGFVEDSLERMRKKNGFDCADGGCICPVPDTCELILTDELQSEDGTTKEKAACTTDHLGKLERSREALEASFLKSKGTHREMMARQLELNELTAEAASVSCVLAMHQLVEAGERSDATSGDDSERKESGILSSDATLQALFRQLHQDDDAFGRFFRQNYSHLVATPAMTQLASHLEETQNRRRKIETVLASAGRGDIPDIIWQERVSREKRAEKLKGEELGVRRRLLEMLLQRIEDGELQTSELYTTTESDDDGKVDTRGFSDEVAEELEKERQNQERAGNVNRNQIGNGRDASASECKNDSSEESCTTFYPSPSETAISAVEEMRKDMEFLQRKAAQASSEEERSALLSIVRKMEAQLETLMVERER